MDGNRNDIEVCHIEGQTARLSSHHCEAGYNVMFDSDSAICELLRLGLTLTRSLYEHCLHYTYRVGIYKEKSNLNARFNYDLMLDVIYIFTTSVFFQ